MILFDQVFKHFLIPLTNLPQEKTEKITMARKKINLGKVCKLSVQVREDFSKWSRALEM